MIKQWKRWVDFVEIKFYSNENIEWHYMLVELFRDLILIVTLFNTTYFFEEII
jgi:hypothetical protein